MHLILILLLQSVPAVDVVKSPSTEMILSHIALISIGVREWDHMLGGNFADDLTPPKIGVFVRSAPDTGTDGLHAITVLGVHADSPAQRAGILPGDRILRIDKRRLEHETVMVVHMIMDNKPGPVQLTIQRGQEVLELTVYREPLPCLARAAELVDITAIRQQNELMLELLAFIQKEMEKPIVGPEALLAAHSGVAAVARFLPQSIGTAQHELHKATVAACRTDFY